MPKRTHDVPGDAGYNSTAQPEQATLANGVAAIKAFETRMDGLDPALREKMRQETLVTLDGVPYVAEYHESPLDDGGQWRILTFTATDPEQTRNIEFQMIRRPDEVELWHTKQFSTPAARMHKEVPVELAETYTTSAVVTLGHPPVLKSGGSHYTKEEDPHHKVVWDGDANKKSVRRSHVFAPVDAIWRELRADEVDRVSPGFKGHIDEAAIAAAVDVQMPMAVQSRTQEGYDATVEITAGLDTGVTQLLAAIKG